MQLLLVRLPLLLVCALVMLMLSLLEGAVLHAHIQSHLLQGDTASHREVRNV